MGKTKKIGIGVGIFFAGIIFVAIVLAVMNERGLEKPNIILIMTDDLSVTMLDVLLENNMMPNLQEHIIDKGTTFTNSFVSSPVCCPSRATFLTGQYPHNTGVMANKPIYINGEMVVDGGFEAFDDSSTIATWLKKDGYKTGLIGKYLNGYGEKNPTYIPPGWDDWKVIQGNPLYYNYTINDNGHVEEHVLDYKTDYIADRAVDFINESDSAFFLFVSTSVPHTSKDGNKCEIYPGKVKQAPLVAPKYDGTLDSISVPYHPSFNEKDVSDKPPSISKRQLIENVNCVESIFRDSTESVRSVDDLIGKIYNTLVENNKQNNTIIIFTSDNGFMFGEHRFIGKYFPYEESIRVPLIITSPGFEKQTTDQLVINNDLAPTIAEFTGVEPDISVDGFSLVPILKDSSQKIREGFLIEADKGNVSYEAIRSEHFLYVESGKPNKHNFIEFYNLDDDPYQLSNLAQCTDQHCLKMMEELGAWLEALKECGNGTCQQVSNYIFNSTN